MPQDMTPSLDHVKLGRLVTDMEHPSEHSHDPESQIPIQKSTRILHHYKESESDLKTDNFGAKLLSLLSLKRSKEMKTTINVTGDAVTSHGMNNYRDWFADIIQQENTRRWLEGAWGNCDDVYLMVEYQVIRNAHIAGQRTIGSTAAIDGSVPVSTAVGAATCMILPSDLVDFSFNALQERGNSAQMDFREEGESVFAVTYRKLDVKKRSSGKFNDKPLGPYMWKRYGPYLSHIRPRLKGLKVEEKYDLLEVKLELELDEDSESD